MTVVVVVAPLAEIVVAVVVTGIGLEVVGVVEIALDMPETGIGSDMVVPGTVLDIVGD